MRPNYVFRNNFPEEVTGDPPQISQTRELGEMM